MGLKTRFQRETRRGALRSALFGRYAMHYNRDHSESVLSIVTKGLMIKRPVIGFYLRLTAARMMGPSENSFLSQVTRCTRQIRVKLSK